MACERLKKRGGRLGVVAARREGERGEKVAGVIKAAKGIGVRGHLGLLLLPAWAWLTRDRRARAITARNVRV